MAADTIVQSTVKELSNRKRRVGAKKIKIVDSKSISGAEKPQASPAATTKTTTTVGVTSRSDIIPEIGRVSV